MTERFHPDGVAGTFATAGVGVALAVALGVSGSRTAATTPEPPEPAPYAQAVAGTPLDCARYANAANGDEAPSAAIIENRDGETRVVSFSRGWDVYTGRAPGVLLAVCTPSGPTSFGPVS